MKNLFLLAFILCFLTIFYLICQNSNAPMDILLSNRIGGLTLLGTVSAIASVVTPKDYQESDILDDNF
jgi:hypothetical protein